MSLPDATTLYDALRADNTRLGALRRLTYRCPHRCLLLDAVAVAETVLVHQKRYKYSEDENLARSNDAGRAANTYDGANHWRERTYWIGQSALAHPEDTPAPRLGITCDHVLDHQLLATDFHADWSAGHADVVIRPDGSRYAVT